ncbi:xanthine dehydrogenase accessory protein XdhC [Roseibacterium sp. SDUM158016]|uniref:xanthine dehydrogenase accessory protein XdhC n=1 Tax=Roseicyclus sediminis TaxID=2980997 RepID=UPI0021D32B34|nr:xanthine dehydrogenase accessory protein XdhC [Roseibacterium sp. SDUM158016]MCU4654442.1 xanthine dehydrogenase accessory protein XdhC [Roseibacterium sp. SDUM158016]
MRGVRVTVVSTRGSAPREAGTQMLVTVDGIEGTIGGGALEWEAMAEARRMLADGRGTDTRQMALGPGLGQCCGGAVTLRFEVAEALERGEGAPAWIWGAGHVGRALVSVLAPLPDLSVTWVDTAAERFPAAIAQGVAKLIAADPPRLMPHAPGNAHHLILTYSHDIDLALCDAALRRGFATCGLIGSETKWARFRSRLAALGHADAEISRIDCPIGDPGLGKHPQAIAVGVAARLLKEQLHKESAGRPVRQG